LLFGKNNVVFFKTSGFSRLNRFQTILTGAGYQTKQAMPKNKMADDKPEQVRI